MELTITITEDKESTTYKTDAVIETENGPKIGDALYGVGYGFGFDTMQMVEREINYWMQEGETEGSIHGQNLNIEWFVK